MHLLLRNSHIISPYQNINGKFDILIVNGVVNRMGVVWQHVREVMEFDMTGKLVVPGFFDMHVHFRQPGQTYIEDINSGALAAAFGGFTGVLCMPNTKPPVDNVEILRDNIELSKENIVNVFSSVCATKNRAGKERTHLAELCASGARAVTDDGSPICDGEIMKEVLFQSSQLNIPVIQHCEVMELSDGGIINDGVVSRKLNVKGIPNESEYKIIERDLDLLKNIKGAHYHVQHISTKEAVSLVRKAKRNGLNVTAEVCPHHFVLSEDDVIKYGSNAKMNPPLRTKDDVAEIINGLRDGTIDVICTDHAPHSLEEKELLLDQAPFGIIGLETAFGLVNTYLVEKKIISIEDIINKMSYNPRKILNLPEIKIQEGENANLTILDLEKDWKVDINKFHSKSKNTPFDGWKLKGKAAGVINNCKHMIYD